MTEPNAYQKAFYRNVDEKNQRDLVNAFKFGSTSPKQYRRWSPEISQDERNRKKVEREQNYIKGLKEEDKPYILIKNKEVYTDPKDVKQMTGALKDKYYKTMKNSEEIDDIHADAQRVLKDNRKKTIVKGNVPIEDPFNINSIYKIDGIEYLPEGFLELEPLLYYDEYFFDDKFDEKRFLEEQRKIKHLRRKQYSNKDSNKKREVTLFIVDQYKDRLAEYLELWYAQNMRRMKDEEIEYVAKELESDFETIRLLQELFLKMKKFENSARLSNFLTPEETRNERISSLPEKLQKHFQSIPASSFNQKNSQISGNKDNRNSKDDITDEQKQIKEAYQQELDKVIQKIRSSSKNPLGQMGPKSSAIDVSESISRKNRSVANSPSLSNQSANKGKTSQAVEDVIQDIVNRNSKNSAISIHGILKGSSNRDTFTGNNKTDAKVRFTEVNQYGVEVYPSNAIEIVQKSPSVFVPKISGASFKTENDLHNKSSMFNSKENVGDGGYNIFTARAKTVIAPDTSQLAVTRFTMASKSANGRIIVEQKLRPTLIMNDYYYQTIQDVIDKNSIHHLTVLTTKNNGEIVAEQEMSPEHLGNFHHSVLFEPKDGNVSKSLILRNEFGETLCVTPIDMSNINDTPKSIHAVIGEDGERKSTVRVIQSKANTIVTHTLKPTLIGNEYYQQLVYHAIGQLGKQTITVQTINQKGDLMFENDVSSEVGGQSYITEVIAEQVDSDNVKKTIITVNERGQVIASNSFVTSRFNTLKESKADTMIEVIESSEGRQIINVIQKDGFDLNKSTKKTFVRSEMLGNDVYIEVDENGIEKNGAKSIVLLAKSTTGLLIAKSTHRPTVMELIGDEYFDDLEIAVEQVLKKEKDNVVISPIGENFTIKVQKSISDQPNKRSVNISVFDKKNTLLIKSSYIQGDKSSLKSFANNTRVSENVPISKATKKPTVMGIIGEDYFEDIENAVEKLIGSHDEQIVIYPAFENFRIKVEQDLTDQTGARSITVSAIDDKGLVIIKKTYRPTINEVIGEHYFDEIMDDIEETMRNQKISQIKQKSTIPGKITSQTKKHTFGAKSSVSENDNIGKNAFFLQLIKNAELSKSSVTLNAKSNFSIFNKPKSRSAMGALSQVSRTSIKSPTIGKVSQVSFGDPKQSFQEQSKTSDVRNSLNTLGDRSGSNNKHVFESSPRPSSERNNTLFNEKPPTIKGGIITDEELVRISSSGQGIGFVNNHLLLLNKNKNVETEGRYNEFGQIKNAHVMHNSQKIAQNDIKLNASGFLKTISSVNPHESMIETNNLIIQKSQEMKKHLENYIDSIKVIQESQISESIKLQERSMNTDDEVIRRKVHEIFNQEKEKLSDQIYKRLQNVKPNDNQEDIMDEFYEFCKNKLPNDEMYKESVLFVSLFYYFLEKKNVIK